MSPVPMDSPTPEQVPVRDAATVMLLRDGSDGPEVCLMQRNLNSDFVGGAYVFPGGAVDPADADADVADRCPDLDDAEASRRLGLAVGGLAFWVAAIRESFEEAGVLLARHADG
ncbi:MAG TPA: NUDIX domain-containing protein, partial [Microthrixaceae bacterium]|nr:NUDIX domain-containing protein [Microthrixaceae bacterium]